MRPITRAIPPILFLATTLFAQSWPTKGHDSRRTSQANTAGPHSALHVTTVRLSQGQAINMPVTISSDGTLFAGTWGVTRSGGAADPAGWDKLDGALFAFDRSLALRWRFQPERVPYCYTYGARSATGGMCRGGEQVSFYNGTVEGVAALSADESVLYVGRGDGKLYSVDAKSGASRWTFRTFNPLDPSDPDGGGEIIAGLLVEPGGTICFATVAAGPYETNAIYAVSSAGVLLWRYPAATASLPNVVWAAPASSPDAATLYVAGGEGPSIDKPDAKIPGTVYALDPGTGRLKWKFNPVNEAESWKPTVWANSLAVGTDGTIFVSGTEPGILGATAVIYALRDRVDHAEFAWPHMIDLDRFHATRSIGLALREAGGVTRRVYANSGNVNFLGAYPAGGKLYALDPATGAQLWPAPFDPAALGFTGAMTGIAIGSDGVIYTGVSGSRDAGAIFAIAEDGSLQWSVRAGGLVEWSHPVVGPEGDLYFGDTRRCPWSFQPVEWGSCDSFDFTPSVYRVSRERQRAIARH